MWKNLKKIAELWMAVPGSCQFEHPPLQPSNMFRGALLTFSEVGRLCSEGSCSPLSLDCIQLSSTQSKPIEINGAKLVMPSNFNGPTLNWTSIGYNPLYL